MMKEDIKPVLSYVAKSRQAEDIVYIYSGSSAAFDFYKDNFFGKDDNCLIGVSSGDDFESFVKQFNQLQGRVWLVFSHMNPPEGIQYLEESLTEFELIDHFEAEGAKTYLIKK